MEKNLVGVYVPLTQSYTEKCQIICHFFFGGNFPLNRERFELFTCLSVLRNTMNIHLTDVTV